MVEEKKRIRVGELFQKVLALQIDNVKKITYDTVEINDHDACEMIAKKILDGQKVF